MSQKRQLVRGLCVTLSGLNFILEAVGSQRRFIWGSRIMRFINQNNRSGSSVGDELRKKRLI